MRLFDDWKLDWQRADDIVYMSRNSPLRSDELSSVDIRMLHNCRIPGLLRLETDGTADAVRLAYRLDGRRPLLQAARGDRLDRENWRRLLIGICTIMNQVERYLLRDDRVVVRQETVWVGRNFDDIGLMYLPVKDEIGKPDFQTELQLLAKSLLDHVSGHRGFHEIELLHSLKRVPFDKTAWMSLWSKSFESDALPKPSTHEQSADVFDQYPSDPRFIDLGSDPVRERSSRYDLTQVPPGIGLAVPSVVDKHAAHRQAAAASRQRPEHSFGQHSERSKAEADGFPKRAAVGLLALLGVVWTFFGSTPSEGAFYICTGCTLLAADGYAFAFSRSGAWLGRIKPQLVDSLSIRLNGKAEPDAEAVHVDSEAYYESLPDHTTLLVPTAEATALLPTAAARPAAELHIDRGDGISDRYAITGNRTIIGKKTDAVQLLQEETGVSRVHAEISFDSDGCWVRDLGSTNGTYLNDNKLEPLQAYPLADGDRVRVVGTTYILRLTSAEERPPLIQNN